MMGYKVVVIIAKVVVVVVMVLVVKWCRWLSIKLLPEKNFTQKIKNLTLKVTISITASFYMFSALYLQIKVNKKI